MAKKTIVIRVDRCLGCKSCEIACAVAHSKSKDLAAVIRSGEKPGYRVTIEHYGPAAVPVHCNHCDEPACLLACPTGTIYRKGEKEPVLMDNTRCIGCKMCVQACPFGVITMNPSGKGVIKCDLCIERLAQGQEPACVAACPTKALVFIEEKEANRDKRRKVAEKLAMAQQEKQE